VHPAPPWTEKQRADNSGFCSPCPTRQRRPEEVVQAAVKVGHTPAHGEHWLASWDLAAAHTSSVVRLEEERQRVSACDVREFLAPVSEKAHGLKSA
jgi:hypothetical protein